MIRTKGFWKLVNQTIRENEGAVVATIWAMPDLTRAEAVRWAMLRAAEGWSPEGQKLLLWKAQKHFSDRWARSRKFRADQEELL